MLWDTPYFPWVPASNCYRPFTRWYILLATSDLCCVHINILHQQKNVWHPWFLQVLEHLLSNCSDTWRNQGCGILSWTLPNLYVACKMDHPVRPILLALTVRSVWPGTSQFSGGRVGALSPQLSRTVWLAPTVRARLAHLCRTPKALPVHQRKWAGLIISYFTIPTILMFETGK